MPGLFLFFIIFAIILMGIGLQMEQKRRAALKAYAAEKGYTYVPGKNTRFDDEFRELQFVGQGSNRYLRHQMTGEVQGHRLWIGEYHYQVTTHNGKSSQTHHYFSTLVMLQPEYHLKDLSIRREGLFDKFKAAFGWDDIDFASAEFSRKFHVSAPDRDWAFAFIQPSTMEFLLQTEGLEYHIRRGWLVVRNKNKIRPQQLAGMLETGLTLLKQVPGFVRETSA